jgi:FkbM family methyltransferase
MIHDLIYDVGMHSGSDTAYYLHRGFRVLAIDADPQACANAAGRFRAEIDQGRLTILNVGIAPEPGLRDFWICETHSEWNSFDRHIASRDGAPHHSIQVPCLAFQQVLEQHGIPYYLKIDIEGHDLYCIDALRMQHDLSVYVSTEVSRFDETLQKLLALGYTKYKCISQYVFLPLERPATPAQRRAEFWYRLLQRRGLPLRLFRRVIGPAGRAWIARRYTRTRRRPDWTFPPGSSGPFGEETPGTWLGAEQMHDTYYHYHTLFQQGSPAVFWRDTPYSFWLDLHARRDP